MHSEAADPHRCTPGQEPVLSVDNLAVCFAGESGPIQAVRGLGFDLLAGQSLAIVGESGAGKSATALAIMGLHPPAARVTGSIRLLGQELIGQDDAYLSGLRGRTLAMIFQDPLSALTPVYTVGEQIVEAIRAHGAVGQPVALRRAIELLDLVGIAEPQRRVHAYPHEFSGGMRQRVMIAMAMANEPRVIVADEPTTALDVTIQAQVLEVLRHALEQTGAALLLVTHDLGVVAGLVDRIMVMYAGRTVEQGPVQTLFDQPCMPYTVGLLGAIPQPDQAAQAVLASIPGSPPSMTEPLTGCPFQPRCSLADDPCLHSEPVLMPLGTIDHQSACHHSARIHDQQLGHGELFPADTGTGVSNHHPGTGAGHRLPATRPHIARTVLQLSDVAQHYPLYRGQFLRRRTGTVRAVDGVDLVLKAGQTLGLVGESGCGKSTMVRAIMELRPPSRGQIAILGTEVKSLGNRQQRRALRRAVQVVFQDPSSSLDPRLPVFDLLAEPLRVSGITGLALQHRVEELCRLVGLNDGYLERYSQQLSGGQRQRVGIARALALEPTLLILDEPVSALDVSIRAGIINLLQRLKEALGLTYLFIAHDLALVRHVADRIAVMYLGRIVEIGSSAAMYQRPAHPYTQALLSAMPIADPRRERSRRRILLKGELPGPANPPSGCRFHTRCPKKLTLNEVDQHRCQQHSPALIDVDSVPAGQGRKQEGEHSVACHFHDRPMIV